MNPLFALLTEIINFKHYMKTSTIIAIIVAVIVVLGGIYYFMQSSGTPTPAATQTDTGVTQTTSAPTLALGTSDTLGTYVKATNGMTLYTNQNDTPGSSTCTDTCATTWPPYTVASTDGLAADPSLTGTIGTLTRGDGTLQVTYNGLPLYFYSQDTNPGDTNGSTVGAPWSIAKS